MNKNQIINQIISEMRLIKAEQEAKNKADYLEALIDDEIAKHDKEIRELTLKFARGEVKEVTLNKAIEKLEKSLDNLLRSKKTEIELCKKCSNSGYIKNKTCGCVLKEYTARLTAESGLETSGIPKNFKNSLKIFADNKEITNKYKKIYDVLQKYCDNFPTNKNLVLAGATGGGKTYSAQIIGNNLLDRGFSVLYVTAFSLIQRFKSYISTFDQSNSTELDPLLLADLLIIDDLGSEPVIKNITEEYLYNIINERLITNRPFIITTNLSPDDLMTRYDQRLSSRILSREKSVVIEFNSQDLRLK